MKLKKIKTNSVLVVVSLLAISLFASCDKDDNGGSSGPKCLISTLNLTWEEVCDGETWSGNETISFSYDSNDRLSKWEWDDGEYLLFTYNSNGKIVKIEEHWGNEVDYLHFTWDGNKVTRQWYWGDEPSSSKMIIEFNSNDEIVRVDRYYNDYDVEWVRTSYRIYTWQNGNLVKIDVYYRDDWKKSAEVERKKERRKGLYDRERLRKEEEVAGLKLKSTSNDFVLGYTTTFTHDNKNNPFSLHKALELWESEWLFHSKNNVISITEVENYEGEEYTWSETYQYEYNAQSYPSKLILEEAEDEDCYWSETIEFNYKNCD